MVQIKGCGFEPFAIVIFAFFLCFLKLKKKKKQKSILTSATEI
jgi:hypothetical protein